MGGIHQELYPKIFSIYANFNQAMNKKMGIKIDTHTYGVTDSQPKLQNECKTTDTTASSSVSTSPSSNDKRNVHSRIKTESYIVHCLKKQNKKCSQEEQDWRMYAFCCLLSERRMEKNVVTLTGFQRQTHFSFITWREKS